jgi:hypothetical protein
MVVLRAIVKEVGSLIRAQIGLIKTGQLPGLADQQRARRQVAGQSQIDGSPPNGCSRS